MKKTDKQIINYHRPVCVKCQCEMHPELNGVGVLDYATTDAGEHPYELWDADKWGCPVCKVEIVVGFGHNPISAHYEDTFQRTIDVYKTNSQLIENHERGK